MGKSPRLGLELVDRYYYHHLEEWHGQLFCPLLSLLLSLVKGYLFDRRLCLMLLVVVEGDLDPQLCLLLLLVLAG